MHSAQSVRCPRDSTSVVYVESIHSDDPALTANTVGEKWWKEEMLPETMWVASPRKSGQPSKSYIQVCK